ncbi:MAG: DUF5671 domain-containing protein [Candidatus Limnocylindria bacterium]
MQTVRRLYLYLMSGVTLGVLLVGLQSVLVVLFDAIGLDRGSFGFSSDPESTRQQLSLAAALIGVGLPVWGIHWGLAQRGLRPGAPRAEEERGSTVRAFYLTLALGLLLAVGASAASDLLRGLFQQMLGAPSNFGTPDVANSLAIVAVTGVAWAYHISIRRRDMRVGPLGGAAAWLPRVYLYGAALGGLFAGLAGVAGLLTTIGDALLPPSGGINQPGLSGFLAAGNLAAILVGGTIWLGHWWYAGLLVGNADWRGESERPARLRLAYFVAVILASTFSVIQLCSAALTAALAPVLGAPSSFFGQELTGRDVVRAAGVALVSALPWAIAWVLHRRAMRREASAAGDPARVATAVRLDQHANALVGLGFAGAALGWLLGLLLDVLLGGDRTSSDFWRSELSTFVPMALIGSAVWLWWWWRIQARQRANWSDEAASTVRRSYLLIILAASVIASLSSTALILYRLFGAILGANLGGNPASELSTPIGALVVAGAIGLYHGQALRRDAALHRAATEALPEAAAQAAGRALVLVGPAGEGLDAAVAALREALPPGYRLDDA